MAAVLIICATDKEDGLFCWNTGFFLLEVSLEKGVCRWHTLFCQFCFFVVVGGGGGGFFFQLLVPQKKTHILMGEVGNI